MVEKSTPFKIVYLIVWISFEMICGIFATDNHSIVLHNDIQIVKPFFQERHWVSLEEWPTLCRKQICTEIKEAIEFFFYLVILSSILTQHEQRKRRREMKGTPNSLYWEEPEDPLDIVPCPFVIFVHTFTVAFSEVLGLFFFFCNWVIIQHAQRILCCYQQPISVWL